MLETVKKMISEPTEPFETYYQQYVFDMQDRNIESEILHINANSSKDLNKVTNCLNEIQKGLKNEFFERV